MVDELPAVTAPGLKETVVPDGAPHALRATDWAEPPVTDVEIVEVDEALCAIERLDGVAPIEKSGLPLPPQPGSLNDAIRVCQLKLPLLGMYSVVYQKVQS